MKLIFAGTPPFAAVALDALIAKGFEIGLVLTQPDRPAGRGMRLQPSAVKSHALAAGLPLLQPASLRDDAVQAALSAVGADAMVVAAYGLILPVAVLNIPLRGCLNIHASLLPRWRGAAPIQRALLAGDDATGITIMQMDEGLDTGPILLQERVAIADNDTAETLHDRLAAVGAQAIVSVLHAAPAPRAQDPTRATYAHKITKAEATINWTRSAVDVCRQVRAFNPVPGAATSWQGTQIKVWDAQAEEHGTAVAGTILEVGAAGIRVGAGTGAVRITELQKAGSKRMRAAAFLDGTTLTVGSRLGT